MTTLSDQASLSLTEAAELLGLAPQTIRRRIKRGEIPGTLEHGPRGLEYRIPASAIADQVTLASDQATQTTQAYPATEQGYHRRGQARVIKARLNSESQPINGARHGRSPGVSPDAAGENVPVWQIRAESFERELGRADEERELLRSHVDTLTLQLQARQEAERELRMMLARLEQTNAELAGALVRRALPAPEVKETPPRRVKWWHPGTWWG